MPNPKRHTSRNGVNSGRRNFIKATAIGAGSLALAGCLGDDDDGDGVTLTVSFGGGAYDENRQQAFLEPWSEGEDPWEENPHDFDSVSMDTGERATALRVEDLDDPPWHLMSQGNVDSVVHQEELDAFHKHSEILDNHENNAPGFRNEVMGGTAAGVWGIAWNRDELGDFEFSDWDDFLTAPIEGRTIVPEWGWTGNDFLYIVNRIEGGDEDNVDPGFDYWTEFIQTQDPVPVGSLDAAESLMNTEDALAIPSSFAVAQRIQRDVDFEVGFVIPESGSQITYFNFMPLRGVSDEELEACVQLLEGMNEPEPQAEFAELQGSIPTNPDAYDYIDDEILEENPAIDIDPEMMERADGVEVNWSKANARIAEDGEEWRMMIGEN